MNDWPNEKSIGALINRIRTMTEEQARELDVCPVCGEDKGRGCIVCWGCFKRADPVPGIPPLKYWDGDLSSWFRAVAERAESEHLSLARSR